MYDLSGKQQTLHLLPRWFTPLSISKFQRKAQNLGQQFQSHAIHIAFVNRGSFGW